MTCFTHECLDHIFAIVDKKQERIGKALEQAGLKLNSWEENDAFKLYQGYIDIVKHVDYETDLQELMSRIE